MRKTIMAASIAAGLTMLAGCGDKTGAGNLTEEENIGLNNASEMLDASADGMAANEDAPLGNGEEDVVVDDNSASNEASINSAGNGQ
jgi:hypothetical protein